jgi:hypothetical protein
VAARLKHRDEVIADRFEETVLFADIVKFTRSRPRCRRRRSWNCSTTRSPPSIGWRTSTG